MERVSQKKKILVTTSAFPRWQGDQRDIFLLGLCRNLTADFEVFVLAPADKGSPKEEHYEGLSIHKHFQFPFNGLRIAYGSGIMPNIKKNGLLLFAVPFYFLFQFFKMRGLVKREGIRIVNAHWIMPQGFVAAVYKRFFNKKLILITTVHGTDLLGMNHRIGKGIKKFVLRNSNGVIAVSIGLKEAIRSCGFSGSLLVCPMGIDTEEFSPARNETGLRQQLGIGEPFLLFVGGLIEAKGIRELIVSMPEVIRKFPEAGLLVAGSGNLQAEMNRLAQSLGLEGHVVFAGQLPHDRLPGYFATADLFVLPSHSEGFGLVIAEAMSSGTLTIASDLPAVHDLITDAVNGFLIRPCDPENLSRKIIEVLENKDQLSAVKEAAREKICTHFDWKVLAGKYSSFIRELCSEI